jgi:hypothetical protein
MANINKAFNFRNGVQVDNDNFIVNANGLVGIGTSIPREFLDVYGTAKVTGLVTATNLHITGFSTFTEVRLGTGIKMSSDSGIITATSFYGNGLTLSNIVGYSTEAWIVNTTRTGISTILNVGIGTTNAQYSLQVGGNPNTQSGVGFNSTGDIKATGIITAGYFSGNGISLTALNATNITSGTIGNSYLPIINNDRLPSNINVSGIITASINFSGNITGNVTGNVNSTGLSTFSGGIVGNVIGIASTARSLTGTPDISVGFVTASSIHVGFVTVGIATIFENLDVGVGGTAFTVLDSGRIGIGTALPASEFQIKKSSATLLEVLSDTSQAKISIGQSVGVGKSTAVLRFGNTSKTFDIINNDTGNINIIIHGGPSGVGTGRFAWLYGQSNTELACLTYDGKFGINETNPINTLHVGGSSTVTQNSYVGQNLIVTGSISAGTFNLPSVLAKNINSNSGISTFYYLNANKIGINSTSPAASIDCQSGTGLFAGVGINTNVSPSVSFQVVDGVALFDRVGVGTTTLKVESFGGAKFQSFDDISVYDSILNVDNTPNSAIVFGYTGTANLKAAIDFSNVGSTNGTIGTVRGYMLPPFLSSTTRNGIGGTEPGAIIWNTTTKKHQGYGSTNAGTTYGWQDLY